MNRGSSSLVSVWRDRESENIPLNKRQILLNIDETLNMVLQLPSNLFGTDISWKRVKEKNKSFEKFSFKYNLFTPDEFKQVLTVPNPELFHLLSQSVSCVGCRRSVERLFAHLVESSYSSLEPLILTSEGMLTLREEYLCQPKFVYSLFYIQGCNTNKVLDSIPKSKKSRRCLFHSLDGQRSRGFTSWIDTWELMSLECKEEVMLIETDYLSDTIAAYLEKHRFCEECRAKVLKAYCICIGNIDPAGEKGFLPSLFAGIRCCSSERHIHVPSNVDYIDHLVARAETELLGSSRREKHAKTMEIAQEEVLTCLGICLYERFHRIQLKLREEEQTWKILLCLGIDALRKRFESFVEDKQGVSSLDLLCLEIRQQERAQELKRQQKKARKKKRKERKEEKLKITSRHQLDNACPSNGDPIQMSSCLETSSSSSRSSTPEMPDDESSSCKIDHPHHYTQCGPTSDPLEDSGRRGVLESGLYECDCSNNSLLTPSKSKSNKKRNKSKRSIVLSQGHKGTEEDSDDSWKVFHYPVKTNYQDDEVKDGGYSSECNNDSGLWSTPSSCQSSDIVCSDGFCSHEGECQCSCEVVKPKLTFQRASNLAVNLVQEHPEENNGFIYSLEKLLQDSCTSDEDAPKIPDDEIREFKAKTDVPRRRKELRQILVQRFEQMCSLSIQGQ